MDIEKARTLALAEMQKWKLLDGSRPWKLRFNKRRSSLGLCSATDRTIYLSTYYLGRVSEVETLDTIRHEIAHALDYDRHGSSSHGPRWKAIAVEVGAKPQRLCKAPVKHAYPYLLKYGDRVVCGFHKLPKNIWSRLPTMGLKGVPESRGKLKLYRVNYQANEGP